MGLAPLLALQFAVYTEMSSASASLTAQAFLGNEEMAVFFLSFYATLRSGHFLDEAMLGPF